MGSTPTRREGSCPKPLLQGRPSHVYDVYVSEEQTVRVLYLQYVYSLSVSLYLAHTLALSIIVCASESQRLVALNVREEELCQMSRSAQCTVCATTDHPEIPHTRSKTNGEHCMCSAEENANVL